MPVLAICDRLLFIACIEGESFVIHSHTGLDARLKKLDAFTVMVLKEDRIFKNISSGIV